MIDLGEAVLDAVLSAVHVEHMHDVAGDGPRLSGFLDYSGSRDGPPLSEWRYREELGPYGFLPCRRKDRTIKP
jgi:hypothetical protein